MREPFVLRKRLLLPREAGPQFNQVYDPDRQIWIDKSSGLPLIAIMSARTTQSTFGETRMTAAREGLDAPAALNASQFGETRLTEAREGLDAPAVLAASQFGETLLTKTAEGHDQSELVDALPNEKQHPKLLASLFGETTITRSSEGHDRISASDFGETVRTFTQEGVDAPETAADVYASDNHI
jgi:hypothetical protein